MNRCNKEPECFPLQSLINVCKGFQMWLRKLLWDQTLTTPWFLSCWMYFFVSVFFSLFQQINTTQHSFINITNNSAQSVFSSKAQRALNFFFYCMTLHLPSVKYNPCCLMNNSLSHLIVIFQVHRQFKINSFIVFGLFHARN